MSIIQPNGKIWLCKNVPLNPSMSDTLYFLSESDRYNYFINSGFYVFKRDDSLTLKQTMKVLAKHFNLGNNDEKNSH